MGKVIRLGRRQGEETCNWKTKTSAGQFFYKSPLPRMAFVGINWALS